jgi:hypothetical protein
MKFCASHWEKLREAIKARGLWEFVAQDGDEVVRRVIDGLTAEKDARSNFEPLMGAHNAIVSNAMSNVGIELLVQNEDGSDKCPICFLQNLHDTNCKDKDCPGVFFDRWIEHAADDQLDTAKKIGLVASA